MIAGPFLVWHAPATRARKPVHHRDVSPLKLPVANGDFRGEASRMNALLIGYARVSTYEQDLTAQRVALERLGVDPAYIFTDHGLTGTNRADPVSAKHSPHAETATRSWSRSSTGWRARCATRRTSSTSSPPSTSNSAS